MNTPRRTIVFYGNCQVSAMAHISRRELDPADFQTVFVAGWDRPGEVTRELSDEELASCVLFFEQIDKDRYGSLDRLPDTCRVIRFPSLDTNLLWPFSALNPYDRLDSSGCPVRPYTDRILLRSIESGMDAESAVDYYLHNYDDYKINLARIETLDQMRRNARDAQADVQVADLMDGLRTEPLFWNSRHPRHQLLNRQFRRLVRAGSHTVPELAALDRERAAEEVFPDGTPWPAFPVHPRVAGELGLTWYDPDSTYPQRDGSGPTHDEYIMTLARESVEARARKHDSSSGPLFEGSSFAPPTEGAVVVGRVKGIYKEHLSAPRAEFEVEATVNAVGLQLRGFYPPQHRQPGTITWSADGSSVTTTAEPGTRFALTLPMKLADRERTTVVLTCSHTLNMLELGESDDNRDVGVLIFLVKAVVPGDEGAPLSFACNICSKEVDRFPLDQLTRGTGVCPTCGSNVLVRSIAYLAGKALFGTTTPVEDWPARRDLVVYGIGDLPAFARYLAPKIGYVDLPFDREPEGLYGTADLVICSETLDRVPPPAQQAFDGLAKLLKPGGAVIVSVPYTLRPTVEHASDIHPPTAGEDGSDRSAERRVFGLMNIFEHFRKAGCTSPTLLDYDVLDRGIRYGSKLGRPMVAIKLPAEGAE